MLEIIVNCVSSVASEIISSDVGVVLSKVMGNIVGIRPGGFLSIGVEGNMIIYREVTSFTPGVYLIPFSDLKNIISGLGSVAAVLSNIPHIGFTEGFHLELHPLGSQIWVVVNDIFLGDIVGLYQTLGDGNFKDLLTYFFSKNWPCPVDLETSFNGKFSQVFGSHLVEFRSEGPEY